MLTRPASLTVTTAPAAEPITLAEAKAHLRIDDTASDTILALYIQAAREHCEEITGLAFVNRTITAYWSRWPRWGFELPGSPLASVSSIKYTDSDGDQTTWDSGSYDVDTDALVGTVKLAEDETFPSTSLLTNKPIEIIYVAGTGADESKVPAKLRAAMLLHIGHMFENREQVVAGTIATSIPFGYDALIDSARVWTI